MSVTDKALKVVAERPASSPPAALPLSVAPVFTADDPSGPPSPEQKTQAEFLAELVLHEAVATPLCVGLFGPAGAGKSQLLGATLRATEALGQAAKAAGIATPFQGEAAILRLTVQPGQSPYGALFHQAFIGLAESHPALVTEAGQASRDPHAAAREAGERLDSARQRLDAERRKLEDLSARQARLRDIVLFEAAGSRVDAYARSHRARIDRSLRRFGFEGDTALTYKELVRDADEPGGSVGRGLGWVRAFWAYRGQTRLILVAVGFFIAFWLIGLLIDNQDALITSLRSSNERMGATADWLAGHGAWLQPLRQTLGLAGLAALAINILRALRFLQPIARGAALLRGDLESRRRDVDGLLAHQTHRVDALAREAEAASVHAADAENRLASRTDDKASPRLPSFSTEPNASEQRAATGFFAIVSNAMRLRGQESPGAPSRLVIALDGFDRVSGREAAAYLDAAHELFARSGIVTLLAADRSHLASGLAETDPALATATLDRIVQVPVRVGGTETPWSGTRSLVQGLLRPDASEPKASVSTVPDAGRSAFDKPWLPKEQSVLEALAPFAGETPRSIKRFINVYRVARADPAMRDAGQQDLAILALGLALQGAGSLPPSSLISSGQTNGDLQAARHAAATALGVALDLGRDANGFAVARRYGSV